LILWRRFYHSPREHPNVSSCELDLIQAEHRASVAAGVPKQSHSWLGLLKLPQTWAIIISKTFTDPVWFFVTDWFPIYLVAKGIELRSGLVAIWVPFLAADAGNFFSGWVSGYLIRRGWSLGWARKALVIFGGVGVLALIPTIYTANLYLIAFLFGFATFAYACFANMGNTLPSDIFDSHAVASVSGMSGTGAGIGTIIAFLLVGHVSDARHAAAVHSFDPIVVVAGLIPLLGVIPVLLLLRNSRATREGRLRAI
jgi:ACS family hexuronate transporter-like MFS transporter